MSRTMVHSGPREDTSGTVDADADAVAAAQSWRWLLGPRLLVAALVAWLGSLIDVDLRSMTDVGLLSVLPISFFIALGVLTVGFLFVLEHRAGDRLLVGGYLITFAAMVHATPALLYGNVRYSWSFKHLGVVDFIQRNGEVDPDATFLQIYHGWPGLFSATAMVTDLSGIDPQTIAIWTPFVLGVISLLALSIVFRAFVDDERIVGLALWLFIIANWVGQEYFSPQGFSYVLYLTLLAVAVPFNRIADGDPDRFRLRDGGDVAPVERRERAVVAALIVALVVVIVSSHQLAPIMVVVTCGVFAAFRVSRMEWVAITGFAAALVWISGPALTYLSDNALDAADSLGSPAETSGASVLDTADVSVGQAIVVVADRFLSEAMLVLAVIGLVVAWRRRRGGRLLLVLIAAPMVLMITDYSGEVLFRAYLFAVPWIALAAALGVIALTEDRAPAVRLAARSMVITLLLVGFLFAYLGKERTNYFTTQEVALAGWLYDNAPPNTLLIEGSRNYPGSVRNYENFFYVPISREPDDSISRIDADPEATLYRWMTEENYDDSYFILTRSMKNEQDSVPSMPEGMLDRIEAALRASERFRVVRSNADGTVWTVVEAES